MLQACELERRAEGGLPPPARALLGRLKLVRWVRCCEVGEGTWEGFVVGADAVGCDEAFGDQSKLGVDHVVCGLAPVQEARRASDVDGQDVGEQDRGEGVDLSCVIRGVVGAAESAGRVVEAERGLQCVDDLGGPGGDIGRGLAVVEGRLLRRLSVRDPVGWNGLLGMKTVLIAGRPMRSIWVSPTLVVAQTPMFVSPPPLSRLLGSSITIDDTF
jgi:hypothetical protein